MIEVLFQNTRDELMKRVEFRDAHLHHCLIALGVVYALAEGIEVAGVKAESAKAAAYLFSYPVAALFMSLYLKEENLIGNLSAYLADLSRRSNRDKNDAEALRFWDDSPFLKGRVGTSLRYRLLSTFIAFVLFPGLLVSSYFYQTRPVDLSSRTLLITSVLLAVTLTIWQIQEYKRRVADLSPAPL